MLIQLVRDRKGKLRGMAVLFKPGTIQPAPDADIAERREYFRVCDGCGQEEAVIYCVGHTMYFCAKCLSAHNWPGECAFISVARLRATSSVRLCGDTEPIHSRATSS